MSGRDSSDPRGRRSVRRGADRRFQRPRGGVAREPHRACARRRLFRRRRQVQEDGGRLRRGVGAAGSAPRSRGGCRHSRRRWSRPSRARPRRGSRERSLRRTPSSRDEPGPGSSAAAPRATPRLSGVAALATLRAKTLDRDDASPRGLAGHQSRCGPHPFERVHESATQALVDAGQLQRDDHEGATAPSLEPAHGLPRGVDRLAAERLESRDEDRLANPMPQANSEPRSASLRTWRSASP